MLMSQKWFGKCYDHYEKQKDSIQSSATALYKVRTRTCLMILIYKLSKGTAEMKSNCCLHYYFPTLVTEEKNDF